MISSVSGTLTTTVRQFAAYQADAAFGISGGITPGQRATDPHRTEGSLR